MAPSRHGGPVRAIVLALISSSMLAVGASPAGAGVQDVAGGAFGYHTDVSLFGGPSTERGPAPSVTLAPDASDSPQDASVDSADAVYGPAVVFRSGRIEVHTEGALGDGGYVTSSASVQGAPDTDERPGPFLFDAVDSTCTVDETGVTASTTITGGVVETRYDPDTQEAVETVPVPQDPQPGHTIEGTLDHVGDRFRITFNEQTTDADGILTVNAAHMELLGPIAVGHVFIGRSVCGVTATGATPSVASAPSSMSPSPAGTTTPTAAPSVGGTQRGADGELAGTSGPLPTAALIGALAAVLAAVGYGAWRRARRSAEG